MSDINLGNYEVVTIILQLSAYIESNNIILTKVNQPLSETLSHIFFNKINFTNRCIEIKIYRSYIQNGKIHVY